jgi:hypothetical protein
MGKFKVSALVMVALLLAAVAVAAARAFVGREVPIASFEFLGCQGDWPMDRRLNEINRVPGQGTVAYVVTNEDTCGADAAKDPKATFAGGTLNLHYVPYSTSNTYAACPCEYKARFTFREEVAPSAATFDGRRAALTGQWPGR